MVKRLLVKNQDKLLPELTQEIPANGIITVGNDLSATIELKDEVIAPEQFVIVCEDGRMTLLCRVDGTEVNGEILSQGALYNLQCGDVIVIGDFTLTAEPGEEDFDSAANGEMTKNAENSPEVQAYLNGASEPAEVSSNTKDKFERSLNDILEGLRSEEKFYFQIEDSAEENRRIYVETEEMWLGWTSSGECALTSEPAEMEIPRAQIRKDWSGVVLYPLQAGNVWLNNEPLVEPHRLKNDDRLILLAKEGAKPVLETVIRFHEPTALLVLDSILPKELPPPILLDNDAKAEPGGNPELTGNGRDLQLGQTPPGVFKGIRKRMIFGYFTITEIIIMAIGTLVTAAIIFLILELY